MNELLQKLFEQNDLLIQKITTIEKKLTDSGHIPSEKPLPQSEDEVDSVAF